MHRKSMSIVFMLFFLAKIIVDPIFLCGVGGALFPLKANNTLTKLKNLNLLLFPFLRLNQSLLMVRH